MSAASGSAPLDVLVIGGGQAGLAMGYHLARRRQRFLIVDAGAEIGDAWRDRWDSLRLFTPAQYDNLPGLPFPAALDTYPGKEDVVRFLRSYAARFELPVQCNTKITALAADDGVYVAEARQEVLEARQVVVATGAFQVPVTPVIASQLAGDVAQLHSAGYRRPSDLPTGRVLVVGAANSGCQIAAELSATHQVELAVGRRIPAIPQRPFGRDVWWWGSTVRFDRVRTDSRLGRRLAGRDQVIGSGPRQLAKRHGIRVRPKAIRASGRTVTFADGSTGEFDAVVWATGFRLDHSWIDVPEAKDAQGRILHRRGVTPSPGLHLLGLSWQHTRGSALLGWVGQDAGFLAERIAPANR